MSNYIKISPRRIVNFDQVTYVMYMGNIDDNVNNRGEVIVGFTNGQELPISDILTHEEAEKFIDTIYKLLGIQ